MLRYTYVLCEDVTEQLRPEHQHQLGNLFRRQLERAYHIDFIKRLNNGVIINNKRKKTTRKNGKELIIIDLFT